MVKIQLKGGVIREFEKGLTVFQIAKEISSGLAKAALACEVDGVLCDLRKVINSDCIISILTFDDELGKKAFWHTASHVLAQATKRIYPNVKMAIGPSTSNGFYYDFDVETPFTPEQIDKIECEMKKIVKEDIQITRFELEPDAAIKLLDEKGEDYKIELVKEHALKGEKISFYQQGEFVDLCAGPHLMNLSIIKALKLTNCTGAYWRGDSNLAQLCRVYGTAFPKASMLEEYLIMVEEAKKRDHNKLGRELGFFTTVDYIGQGLPILLPKGAKVIQILQRFVEDEEEKRGYLMTKTPLMAKSDLFKISGHWDKYQDGLFILGDANSDKEIFALRPMTCPFQFQAYLTGLRSYRDLPMRLSETSTLFRNESSGEMHGLIRLRQFTISEGHLVCTPEQLEEEFKGCVDIANFMLKAVGLEDDVSYRFSKWDENNKEKYIGSKEQWESVQNQMLDILNTLDMPFTQADGEAAFYGPKLDIQIKNVHGKEDTLITIQIDFQLAKRFEMDYIDKDGEKKHPYIIHRTSIGCYERTLALLIEKYAGGLPLWLAPIQVKVLPIGERQYDYARDIKNKLQAAGIRVIIDERNEKIGYKIREAQLEKVNYMVILGDKEVESKSISVRSRKDGDLGTILLDDFVKKMDEEIINRICK